MGVAVIVGIYGDQQWGELARSRPLPAVDRQTRPADELLLSYGMSLAQARNAGAQRARSRWLLFLDADDELDRRFLERVEPHLGCDDHCLLNPAVQYVDDDTGARQAAALLEPCDLIDRNYLIIGTLIRRDFFLDLGGFDDYKIYEDWELWLRAHQAGAHVVQVPEAVYIAHTRSDSRNNQDRSTRERIYLEIRRKYRS